MATSKSATAKKPATKPVAKKTTATATTKTAAARKPAATVKKSGPVAAKKPAARTTKAAPAKIAAPTPEQRYKMVQDAAYFIAEKNGFQAGSMDYWIAAEAEIAALLSGKKK